MSFNAFSLPSSLLSFCLLLFLFKCLANCLKDCCCYCERFSPLKMKTAELSFKCFVKEMAAHSILLCNAVIYRSMRTISVNHLLSLACLRSPVLWQFCMEWKQGLNIVHSDRRANHAAKQPVFSV